MIETQVLTHSDSDYCAKLVNSIFHEALRFEKLKELWSSETCADKWDPFSVGTIDIICLESPTHITYCGEGMNLPQDILIWGINCFCVISMRDDICMSNDEFNALFYSVRYEFVSLVQVLSFLSGFGISKARCVILAQSNSWPAASNNATVSTSLPWPFKKHYIAVVTNLFPVAPGALKETEKLSAFKPCAWYTIPSL